MTVLGAWRELQRLKRDEAAMAELPVANLCALTGNINRDPKKGKPFSATDFALFRDAERPQAQLSPAVAAVALALRHEDLAPPILLAAWSQILASATDAAPVPSVRALKNDAGTVWVLAPTWEGKHVRGGLVAVTACAAGRTVMRDIDRPLATYVLDVPKRPLAGWLEGGLLLLAAENLAV